MCQVFLKLLRLGRSLVFGDVAIDIIVALESALDDQFVDVVLVDLEDRQEEAGTSPVLAVVVGQLGHGIVLQASTASPLMSLSVIRRPAATGRGCP